ncbi:uncharacterized protein J8A68_000885 [[Candida] subhashii]|uniref:Reverse transcriptase domain-containing protein n=1 Tax=[Candida] subhashii TaxID=561895 RepID=A0A8J5QS76_9ASCO|nr:uncharacterized protein J8A68_000885 [[Candida] subhashii]KAG7665483.1 hypothetical protein J8A68_000885 [[Candida] subhashii]
MNEKIDTQLNHATIIQPTAIQIKATMQDIIDHTNIIDAYRHIEPDQINYTNHHYKSNRRIDRIYISQHLHHRLHSFQIHRKILQSTHDGTSITITPIADLAIQIGPKPFVYNDELLQLPIPNTFLNSIISRNLDEFILRGINYGISMNKLQYKLHRTQSPLSLRLQINETTNQIYKTLNNEFKGHIHTKQYISHMSNEDNTITTTTTHKMLDIAYDYFKKLYNQPLTHFSPEYIDQFLENFPITLDTDDQLELERPIEADEIYQALQRIDNKKSPGPDGLTVNFYKTHWGSIGHFIEKEINDIMNTGILPYHLREVLIRIIPKTKKKTDTIDNFRPIALTNILTRVISNVINCRFTKHHDKLVQSPQRGFMNERQIDENLMEFYNIIDLTLKYPSPNLQLLMLDLNKAFDRIDHMYIKKLLIHIGIGPKMRRLILSTVTQLKASIKINNFNSPSFQINIGILQGLSFSPVLFNICLEPFLHKISQVTQGYYLEFHHRTKIQIKYQAFADDINIYMNNLEEQQNIATEIKKFERATNSLISREKTTIYYYDTYAPRRILPYQQSDIHDSELTYLGIPIQGTNWPKFLNYLNYYISKSLVREWPISYSTTAINSYIYSKIYYREFHDPMPLDALESFRKKIDRKFYGIRWSTLTNRPELGGYGLLELSHQLKGRKAALIYKILTAKEPSPTTLLWRIKIHQATCDILTTELTSLSSELHQIIPWYDILLGLRIPTQTPHAREFYGYFIHHDSFTRAEKSILSAWFELTYPLHPSTQTNILPVNDEQLANILHQTPSEEKINFLIKDINDEQLTGSNFLSISTKTILKKNEIEADPRLSYQFHLTTHDWQQYWFNQKRLKHKYPGKLEELHRIHLGHRSHLGSTASTHPIPHYPNRHLRHCLLCLNTTIITPDLHHIYQDCPVTSELWTTYSSGNYTLEAIIGQHHHPDHTYLIIDRFFQIITKLWFRPRYSKSELRPVTEAQLILLSRSFTQM